VDKETLNNFIKGEATTEEVRKVLKWYYSDDADYAMTVKIEQLWSTTDKETKDITLNKKQIFNKIRQKIQDHENVWEYQILPKSSNSFANRNFLKIVASILFLVGVSWFIFNFSNISLNQKDIIQATKVSMQIKSTTSGQKFTIFLADGTKVKLNSDSRLEYPQAFSDTSRIVHLSGEAFFDVKKDAQRPFTVISHNLITTALGTSFNINAYPGNDNIIVSLATGKVRVSNETGENIEKSKIMLEPGNQAIYSNSNNAIKKQPFDASINLAWKNGVLYFEDASWSQIVNKLERWYGVDISVANQKSSSNKLYTGFFKEESLENVLESLSFSKNFKYKIKSQKVYVEFK